MLHLKNTIQCPGCEGILRASVQLVSDGTEFQFYLCPRCEKVVREDPSGAWTLHSERLPHLADLVRTLQAVASEDWKARSTSRVPRP
jgi:hypothetical protein